MLSNKLEQEELIFNLIQDYLNNNQVFQFESVIPYIKNWFARASININTNGIKRNIKSLLKKKKIVESSVLTQNDILKNENRRKVFEFVQNNPGAYFNKIVKSTGLSIPVVKWHLDMLVKFGCIQEEEYDNRDIFGMADLKSEKIIERYILSNKKSQKIMFYLRENDIGLTKTQLADALQMHPNTVTKYLAKLEEINAIVKEKMSRNTLYFIHEKYY